MSRTHPRQTSRSHAHTNLPNEERCNQQTTPPRITATLPQPPPRASALASGTITCASSTDLSASASACRPKQARCLRERVRSRSRRRGGRPRAAARTTRHLRACATAGGFGGGTRAGEARHPGRFCARIAPPGGWRHSRAALIGHRATGCPARRRRGEDEEKTAHGQPVARWPINAARECRRGSDARLRAHRTVHRSVPPALR